MKLHRNAKALGLFAALLIVSFPTASADHHPGHVSQCDPYPVVSEVVCTSIRNPISQALLGLYADTWAAAAKFGGKILEVACDIVESIIGPMFRADTQTILHCPW